MGQRKRGCQEVKLFLSTDILAHQGGNVRNARVHARKYARMVGAYAKTINLRFKRIFMQ